MADYPSYTLVPQVLGSTREPNDGTEVDRAESGRPRFRTMYSQTWSIFKIVHDCDATQFGLVTTHYLAHQFVSFTLTWAGDATNYTVRYANHPKAIPTEGNDRWKVESLLVQVP